MDDGAATGSCKRDREMTSRPSSPACDRRRALKAAPRGVTPAPGPRRPREAGDVGLRRQGPRALAAAHEDRRRGSRAGDLRPGRAEALLAPALRQPDHEQAGALGGLEDAGRARARPPPARSGSRRTAARAARRRPGGGPRGCARRCRPSAPSILSGAPVAEAIQAPSSSAAQSCSAPPNGTTTGWSLSGLSGAPSRAT